METRDIESSRYTTSLQVCWGSSSTQSYWFPAGASVPGLSQPVHMLSVCQHKGSCPLCLWSWTFHWLDHCRDKLLLSRHPWRSFVMENWRKLEEVSWWRRSLVHCTVEGTDLHALPAPGNKQKSTTRNKLGCTANDIWSPQDRRDKSSPVIQERLCLPMTGRVAPWVVSYTWWQKVILLAWERSQRLCRLTPLKGGRSSS